MDRTKFAPSARRTKLSAIAPASPEAVEHAADAGADVVQLDLENSTPPADKERAREGARDALRRTDWHGAEVWVRVNAVDSGLMEADVDVVSQGLPDAFILAKVDTADDVRTLAARITRAEQRHGLPVGRIRIGVVIESALGLSNVEAICVADPRMTSLSIGANDLTKDLGIWRDPTGAGEELLYARSRCVLAARLAGIDACDHAYPGSDPVGVARASERSFRLGFSMKTCWSPAQIPTIHAVHALGSHHRPTGPRAAPTSGSGEPTIT